MTRRPPKPGVKVYVRTSVAVRKSLQLMVARVNMHGDLRVSQEVFIAASWLWMETIDPAELAAAIAPYVERAHDAIDPPGTDPPRAAGPNPDPPPSPGPWPTVARVDRTVTPGPPAPAPAGSAAEPDPERPARPQRDRVPPRRRK